MEDRFFNWAAAYIADRNIPEERVVLTDFCIKLFTRWFKKFNSRVFQDTIHKLRLNSK